MKQAAELAKIEKKRDQKRHEKAQEKAQSSDFRRLAIQNRQAEIESFKAILSDLITITGDDKYINQQSNEPTPTIQPSKLPGLLQSRAKHQTKRTSASSLTSRLSSRPVVQADETNVEVTLMATLISPQTPPARRLLTLPPMELIRPGKRKVKIPAHAVESTPPKQMRART